MGLGVVGTYCDNCGTYFLLEGKLSEQSWAPKGFLERLGDRFSSPKSIIIGSAALLVLFVAFWGLLHLQPRGAAKQIATLAPVASEESPSDTNETASPAPVVVAPEIAKLPSSATQSALGASAPITSLVSTGAVPHPLAPPENALDDKKVGEAIRRAAHYLLSRYDPETCLVKNVFPSPQGENALCVYALLQCNDAISDPDLTARSSFMSAAIEAMKNQPIDARFETYGRSLRANALALVDRSADRSVLTNDVGWLLSAQREGAYTYAMPAGDADRQAQVWDNSNSQYGLLGVWAGAEAGMSIPDSYWREVQSHWAGCQNADGSFGYSEGRDGALSMTAAGVATLFIVHDFLALTAPTGSDSRSAALMKALAWMNDGDRILQEPSNPHFRTYALYGITRAGLASGCKFFGRHDWYTELALRQLKLQHADGSFGDSIDTAFTLLFLARASSDPLQQADDGWRHA